MNRVIPRSLKLFLRVLSLIVVLYGCALSHSSAEAASQDAERNNGIQSYNQNQMASAVTRFEALVRVDHNDQISHYYLGLALQRLLSMSLDDCSGNK